MQQLQIIPPRSGAAFQLKKGQRLRGIDPEVEQVSDFICFNSTDTAEYLSGGGTLNYTETVFLTKGCLFYSNH